ncbi:MAG: sigma 54-interacting transcriptional regulator [Planctomycetaceae bacterium]|nr:sigma 54-interacting transcriptional regulator [Planctomycetaceae bacterium]
MHNEADRSGRSPLYLILHRDSARLDVIELPSSGRITVGRAPSNRIILNDSKCSRQHCELFLHNNQWTVRDLESRNGVTVGREAVSGDRPLELGETIGVGSHELTLTDRHPDQTISRHDTFEIIDRKTGTQFDTPGGIRRLEKGGQGATDLFRLARIMAAAETEQELCETVLRGLTIRTSASMGGVLLMPLGASATAANLQVRAVHPDAGVPAFSTYLSGVVLDDGHAVLAQDLSGNKALAVHDSIETLSAESVICVPIRHAGEVYGVIHLYSRNKDHRFSHDDLEYCLGVADQMGDHLYGIRQKQDLEAGLDKARVQVAELQDQLAVESELVGHSPTLERVRQIISRVAPSDATVLVRGESGVGKELVARAVHLNSNRREGPFVCVNCAALTESLLESELFGHEKGAFTGAAAQRAGKFEQADGGTLFLDEIGEMSPEIQAKFLRVLEGQAFERVGGGKAINTNVRVVTATNRNLEEAVQQGEFRRDLFFRLQVIELTVPALREHPEDIPAIAQHFVERFSKQSHRKIRGLTTTAVRKLQQHDWPGNVRELRNVIERAVILAEDEMLGPEDIVLTRLTIDPTPQVGTAPQSATTEEKPADTAIDPLRDLFGSFIQKEISLEELDRLYILAVLDAFDGNKSAAARLLQFERTTLDRRLKKYGMSRPGEDDDTEV